MIKLGKIEEVNLRTLWTHEAHEFTPWLAEKENLAILSETIGLSLSEPKKEVSVGSFSADVVCTIEDDNRKVIIENQLEDSNHDHLGKTIVYASGLNASIVIWIVKQARDEHASAIEWLNEHTDSDISFFLIEIKALKIGDSLPAPKFEIIRQPNNYEKIIKSASNDKEKTDTQLGRYNFWMQFKEFIDRAPNTTFTSRKPNYDHWKNFAMGSSDYHLGVVLLKKENVVGVEFYIEDNKKLFDKLFSKKDEIDDRLGVSPSWDRLDEKKAAIIRATIPNLNLNDEENWQELSHQTLDLMEKFKKVFQEYL